MATPHESPNTPEHTAIVQQAMQEMAQNQAPGQANGPKNGYVKQEIKNPNASTPIHGHNIGG